MYFGKSKNVSVGVWPPVIPIAMIAFHVCSVLHGSKLKCLWICVNLLLRSRNLNLAWTKITLSAFYRY